LWLALSIDHRGRSSIHAAVGSASGSPCYTALQCRRWQTVIAFRAVAVTSVELQIGQTLQVAGNGSTA
jgi:hypothetical protein